MKAPLNLALLSRIAAQPWAIREQTLAAWTQAVLQGDPPRPQADTTWNIPHYDEESGEFTLKKYPTQKGYTVTNHSALYASLMGILPEVPDGVSVITVWGPLGRGWTYAERYYFDAIDVDEITSSIASAPAGDTVVLWFRSPGGLVTGTPEAAAAIAAAGQSRRILSFTDDLCASAAYWLASQTERIIATPTADVGSIGVYLAYYDFVGYLEKMGVKLELFRAGTLKGIGVMGNPLDDAAREHLQRGVVDAYKAFTSSVTAMRAIAPEHMQGQTLQGKAAKNAALVDGFRDSAADFFAALGKGRI